MNVASVMELEIIKDHLTIYRVWQKECKEKIVVLNERDIKLAKAASSMRKKEEEDRSTPKGTLCPKYHDLVMVYLY